MENTCRTCLKTSNNLKKKFDNNDELPYKIKIISSIQILASDNLPSKICEQCTRNIHLLFDFRNIIIRSNIILTQRCASATIVSGNNLISENIPTVNKITDTNISVTKDLDITNVNFDELDKKCHTILNENAGVQLNKRVYLCNKCEFKCMDYKRWKNHKYAHTDRIKSICNVCGKSVRATSLRTHILTHTDSKVECKECGKTFKSKMSLSDHVPIHKGIKLQCNICGKVFRYRPGLTAHIKRHALGDIKTAKCPLCSKLFSEKKSLKKHMRSHTGERPYPCKYCKKGFSSSYALKTHVRQHTNEKPYKCQLCPSAFRQNVSLKTHLKSKHPTETVILNS